MALSGYLDYEIVRAGASSKLSKLSRLLYQSNKTRLFWAIAGALLIVMLIFSSGWHLIFGPPDFSVQHPTQPVTMLAQGEISPLLKPYSPKMNKNGTFASGVKKTTPNFYLIIRGSWNDTRICRTLFTSMILNYPPPTAVYPDDSTPKEGQAEQSELDTALVMYNYLTKSNHMKDDDILLIVDNDIWFQLPPEVMLQRFHEMLKKSNEHLRQRYGSVLRNIGKEADISVLTSTQKYSQRIIFAADKIRRPDYAYGVSGLAVLNSTLAPDIHGPETDSGKNTIQSRSRWLNAGSLIGLVGDVKLLYKRAAEINSKNVTPVDEQTVLSQIFKEQEYVRELDRSISLPNWYTKLGRLLGILPRVNISNIFVNTDPGRRFEYSIGLDYKSNLFFTASHAESDLEWLTYNNISRLNSPKLTQRVPNKAPLYLPKDISRYTNPFNPPDPLIKELMPPYNETVDYLPDPQNTTWHAIPLATNVLSASIPTLLCTNPDNTTMTSDTLHAWWDNMWYHPYSRRAAAAQEAEKALFGWPGATWNVRGGKGGLWTEDNLWMDWSRTCKGVEEQVFGDKWGLWGEELGFDYQAPVFNKFGLLVKGKERAEGEDGRNRGKRRKRDGSG
ncbi:hypothetical protein PAAG_05499 [Paracoccidioides lutzii Pb01]|uniref:Uncharacterized protein n=1 Tax=Paracoccidioides lutzii (strain ATCC MYA-826 / Pb01) TaxID=502779 RepID=C1H406_PARBA|nr:hypothetical protein PAAG_05499 [Paracoccidioides lutzii Pb01]EEH34450.2 hypothetical protein PAAG_05499 [Paracoccidioides lutzii Pb01]